MLSGANVVRLLSLVSLTLLLLGGLGVYFSDRGDYCEMTYMFEYPQFVRITVPENERFPQYALFSYSEGRLTERARKMRFDGIPVLFLPGNSGSRSQARSIASVALRKAYSSKYDYHFDFFTVSFNEELSGLYGGVLEQLTEFSALALHRILSLYSINSHVQSVPTTVLLIGHSMGGVIAKRLLTYPGTQNLTNIAITLAAPLSAPVLNMDPAMDNYYLRMAGEWRSSRVRDTKVLLSFGGGAKDVMVPSSLISSEFSDLSALITAIPGVWTSADHLSIVWCKQFVMTINKFLFSIVDHRNNQIIDDKKFIVTKARQYFQANRSMTLSPNIRRGSTLMVHDAFWYEDNRRIYQISRPEITKMTYLMIRLVGFHLDRFIAIEAVNLDDKDWIFGCTANDYSGPHRIWCKNATSLSELSRWTGSVDGSSLRKLATVHLHELMLEQPQWTHVIVKISPTRKPIMLNVDINDYASREITVDLPSYLSFGTTVIKEQTEQNSLYYELILPGMDLIHDTYLLYVEPTASCKAAQYHVSAEMHVPWASNFEYYHYFTHLKKKPMKLRLFKSNPNATNSSDVNQHVKVTLLLDPQCTFSISMAPSRYHMLAQLGRQHLPVLLPCMAAILLLASRSSLLSLVRTGSCESVHTALASEAVRPYYALVFGRLGTMFLTTVPILTYTLDTSGLWNWELHYLRHSLLCVPAYMAALGMLNVFAAGALATIVFCSQLAHRLLLRILWRGGGGTIAEKLASLLQRAPALVSAALVCSVPASCGAAALAAGGAFYFFMLSKMYEEYLEDYAYKLLAKIGTRIRNYFKSGKTKPSKTDTSVALNNPEDSSNIQPGNDKKTKFLENTSIDKDEKLVVEDKNISAIPCISKETDKLVLKEAKPDDNKHVKTIDEEKRDFISKLFSNQLIRKPKKGESENFKATTENAKETAENTQELAENPKTTAEKAKETVENAKETAEKTEEEKKREVDEQLNGLNFHSMMFFLWAIVTMTNLPALLTWARNFKHIMALKPDTSFYPGIIMSVCAGFLWQVDSPRRNLKYYDTVAQIMFALAIIVLVMGPLAIYYINYAVTTAFVIITAQQLFDSELPESEEQTSQNTGNNENESTNAESSEETDVKTEDSIHESLKNMKGKVDFGDTGFI